MTVAHHHASLFPARMALARWTRGGDIPHVHAAEQNMPMRAAWYAEAQQRFQSWLDAGGFHYTGDNLDCALYGGGINAGHGSGERGNAPFPVPGISGTPAPDGDK
jgi:hypothetical protein